MSNASANTKAPGSIKQPVQPKRMVEIRPCPPIERGTILPDQRGTRLPPERGMRLAVIS